MINKKAPVTKSNPTFVLFLFLQPNIFCLLQNLPLNPTLSLSI